MFRFRAHVNAATLKHVLERCWIFSRNRFRAHDRHSGSGDLGGPSAVDRDDGARNERSPVGGEERGDFRDLHRLHSALHGRYRVRNQRRDLPSGTAIAVRGKTLAASRT